MSTHNICFYKEVDTNIWSVTWTKILLDCVLIEICAVIRSNTVHHFHISKFS